MIEATHHTYRDGMLEVEIEDQKTFDDITLTFNPGTKSVSFAVYEEGETRRVRFDSDDTGEVLLALEVWVEKIRESLS